MARRKLSDDIKDVCAWLERQTGVTNVVRSRYTRVKHHHGGKWFRALQSDDKSVHVRVYDHDGVQDVMVYAKPSADRDAWVARVVGGARLDELTKPVAKPKAAAVVETPKVAPWPVTDANVPMPKGQLINDKAASLMDVTPELAMRWLERNTRNRKLRQSTVNKYAADMRAGRWMVTGDAIGFDTNGAIINGQHRLWAVIEAGCAVPMQVALNLDPDAVSVMDDHMKRSLTDVAEIRTPGSRIGTKHAAIANMLVTTSITATSVEPTKAMERVSRQVQLEALDRHMDAILFAVRDCFKSKTTRLLTSTPVMTPFARAYYTQDRELLKRFAHVLMTGMGDGKEDQPALVLRNYLLRALTQGIRPRSEIVYRKTERALAAALVGEHIKNLYEASEEAFPLPEEQKAVRKSKK